MNKYTKIIDNLKLNGKLMSIYAYTEIMKAINQGDNTGYIWNDMVKSGNIIPTGHSYIVKE